MLLSFFFFLRPGTTGDNNDRARQQRLSVTVAISPARLRTSIEAACLRHKSGTSSAIQHNKVSLRKAMSDLSCILYLAVEIAPITRNSHMTETNGSSAHPNSSTLFVSSALISTSHDTNAIFRSYRVKQCREKVYSKVSRDHVRMCKRVAPCALHPFPAAKFILPYHQAAKNLVGRLCTSQGIQAPVNFNVKRG